MRRAAWTARDALLWWGVLLVCAAAYLLHLNAIVSEDLGWLPVTLSHVEGDAYPRVAAKRSDLPEAERDLLAVGDPVLTTGGETLRGRGGLAGALLLYEAAAAARDGRVYLETADANGTPREVAIGLVPIPHVWRASLLALSFVAVGALTYRRAPRRHAARLFFLAAAGYALHWSYFFGGPSAARTAAGMATVGIGLGLAMPLGLLAALSFAEDAGRRGAAASVAPWLFALVGAGAVTWAFGGPLPPAFGAPLTMGGSILFLVSLALALVDQWRRTGPMGRRQTKWVMLGALAAFVPPLLAGGGALVRPELEWVYEVSLVTLVLLPLGIFMALARDHLFDVDRLLTTASTLSILGVLFVAGVIAAIPGLAAASEEVVDPTVSQPALALLAAGGLLAARSRVSLLVERALFPERPALAAGADALRRELADCVKPVELFQTLGTGLAARLRTQSVVVYGNADTVFAPLFEQSRAVVPAFDAEGPMVGMLSAAPRIVDRGTLEAALAREVGSQAEFAALRSMGTELLLPVVRGSTLEAFVCLGDTYSGEMWGATELALLQSIADKAADELRRFDLEQVHEAQREMVGRLRRWVPHAVAERAAQSREMPSGQLEVSVLFVDLRGYTALAQAHGPQKTFDLVSRYTEAVSDVVQRHGGTVVDFQGDGLMAVFGAPDPLPDKERAAIAAGLALIERVRRLPTDHARPELGAPELGVGIATGSAFVGPLRAADRTIWSVLGDTTNLAARLQALTSELEVTLIIDDATRRGAGALADGLAVHHVSVRGRHGRVYVHALPRGWHPPALPEVSP